jgi:aldose sugar dehydrogenase
LKLLLLSVLAVAMIGLMVPNAFAEPILYDDDLIVEEFAGLSGWGHTTMTFVGDDILLLHKTGSVSLIRDGIIQEKPVLEVSTQSIRESGLLGITSVDSSVYIYFTEYDEDETSTFQQLGNKIYKYDWNGEFLINPVLIKELPSNEYHDGGAMVTGLDNQVYAVIGDTGKYGPLQNKLLENLFPPDTLDYMDTSVILRVSPEGPYYAMGIRNSFGLAIDPLTGNLWATENGDDNFDEINFVPDKFNSGWEKIMGPATEEDLQSLPGYEDYVYSDPEFTWEQVVAPVAINFGKFKETSKYDNSVFVGDCNTGNLYKFELNENRDGFEFSSPELQDNIVNQNDSMDEIIIGTGFGCVSDIERGPDGFLYLISHGERKIYKMFPREALVIEGKTESISEITPATIETKSESEGGGCLIATAAFGSEMAPQVQFLRELRDNTVLQTTSGTSFMNGFNQFYYSFSPAVADYERENQVFKEAVKVTLTPMLTSLTLLNYVDVDTEEEMLGYGIGIILLNVGMYFVAPAVVIIALKRKFL